MGSMGTTDAREGPYPSTPFPRPYYDGRVGHRT